MTTASDILNSAARSLGFLGDTAVLSAAKATDGLAIFNAMLDSWTGGEVLTAYVTESASFPLVVGQQTYTIGVGGQINAERPFDIVQAFVRDVNNLDYPLSIIPQNEWNSIGNKNITSQIPTTLYYYTTYPLGVINIFPIPLVNYTIFYFAALNQVPFALLTQTMIMPPGYERAFKLNLAVEMMAAGWPCLLDDRQYTALVATAAEAKGNVKRANLTEVIAEFDESIISRSNATYNVYTNGYPRGP